MPRAGADNSTSGHTIKTCLRHCSRVHHVQTDADLNPTLFFDGHTVGITAGTSTPDAVIDRVETHIRTFARGRGFDAVDVISAGAERAR